MTLGSMASGFHEPRDIEMPGIFCLADISTALSALYHRHLLRPSKCNIGLPLRQAARPEPIAERSLSASGIGIRCRLMALDYSYSPSR